VETTQVIVAYKHTFPLTVPSSSTGPADGQTASVFPWCLQPGRTVGCSGDHTEPALLFNPPAWRVLGAFVMVPDYAQGLKLRPDTLVSVPESMCSLRFPGLGW